MNVSVKFLVGFQVQTFIIEDKFLPCFITTAAAAAA